MLLIYPPIAKPSEPPAGIAKLAGALLAHNHPCRVVDFNIEGLLHLLNQQVAAEDLWSRRASRNRHANIAAMRKASLYGNFGRYQKCVLELNRLLEIQGKSTGRTVGLANYHDETLSPLRSSDLLQMAEEPQRSPFHAFFVARLEELLADVHPPCIGISINYLSQALNGFALIGLIRRMMPGATIFAGGGLITSWMRSPAWNNPFAGLIDHCIAGPGEEPLLRLLGSPPKRKQALPRFDLLPEAHYLSPGSILPYSSSSGCFWNRCSFCPERAEGNPFRARNPECAIDDINALHQAGNPVLLHLLDNAIPPALLRRFNEATPGLPWYGFVRIGRELLDIDFCRNLRRSGCVMLKIGLESGDQGVLDRMEKGIALEQVSQVLDNLSSCGIATYVYLLFGTPAEGPDQARATLEFTRRHHRQITFLNLAIFNMPRNSTESMVLPTSTFSDGDLSLYSDFAHPLGWDRRAVRLFLDRQFKRQPEIAAILRRDPPLLTSNHAPFFCPGMKLQNTLPPDK